MADFERRPNRGVAFTHKKGKHPDLLEDGTLDVDMKVCCPQCQHKFVAMAAYFFNAWRPKSDKVHRNLSITQKDAPNQSFEASTSQRPATQSNQYTHQTSLGQKPQAKAIDRKLDDEIPF